MSEFLRRIRLPLLFAALVLGTLALMLGDRAARARRSRTGLSHALARDRRARAEGDHAPRASSCATPGSATSRSSTSTRENRQLREQHRAARAGEPPVPRGAGRERAAAPRSRRCGASSRCRCCPSQVVGQDASAWSHALLLDRGRASEVRSGMPVLVDRGPRRPGERDDAARGARHADRRPPQRGGRDHRAQPRARPRARRSAPASSSSCSWCAATTCRSATR